MKFCVRFCNLNVQNLVLKIDSVDRRWVVYSRAYGNLTKLILRHNNSFVPQILSNFTQVGQKKCFKVVKFCSRKKLRSFWLVCNVHKIQGCFYLFRNHTCFSFSFFIDQSVEVTIMPNFALHMLLLQL